MHAVYLSDFASTGGASDLLAQAAAVDLVLGRGPGPIVFYIDSGREDGPPQPGHAMRRLVRDVGSGLIASVYVESLDRLGPTGALAQAARGSFLRAGVQVVPVAPAMRAPQRLRSEGRGAEPIA